MGAIQSVLAWWPGDDTNYVVAGFSVKTWGRVGKLMQYTGGLVALIEIVGEKRLQIASGRLHALASWLREKAPWLIIPFSLMLAWSWLLLIDVAEKLVRSIPSMQSTSIGAILLIVLGFLIIVGLLLPFLPMLVAACLIRLGRLSSSTISLKKIGFVIVTIGFALDFLAS